MLRFIPVRLFQSCQEQQIALDVFKALIWRGSALSCRETSSQWKPVNNLNWSHKVFHLTLCWHLGKSSRMQAMLSWLGDCFVLPGRCRESNTPQMLLMWGGRSCWDWVGAVKGVARHFWKCLDCPQSMNNNIEDQYQYQLCVQSVRSVRWILMGNLGKGNYYTTILLGIKPQYIKIRVL